jgi:hypothetical protein
MDDDLPTPRSISRIGYRVHVWCKSCRHAKDADLAALVGRRPWGCTAGADEMALWQLRLTTDRIPRRRFAHEAGQRLVTGSMAWPSRLVPRVLDPEGVL